jgi:hypothetical protein
MTSQFFNARFTYDPLTGDLFWKERPLSDFKDEHNWKIFMSKCAGKKAGYPCFEKSGRRKCIQVRIKMAGKTRLIPAHRIIYAIMGVSVPHGFEIDHKDCDAFNNVWTNLRLATRVQNAANQMVHVNRKHTELPKGVSTKRGRFRAQIGFGGKQIYLGTFATAEAANAAYASRAKELYGDFSRAN